MVIMKVLIFLITAGLFSSCARTGNQSKGLVSVLLDGVIGSDPDGNDYHSDQHHDRRYSSADNKKFISKNEGALRESLKNKKR